LTKEQICAIIVTHHPDQYISDRIDRIINQVNLVIIIDNASLKEEIYSISEKFSKEKVKVIVNSINKGLGFALNQGIEYAKHVGYSWVLTLDQDSMADTKMVIEQRSVYDAMNNKAQIGIIASHPVDSHTGKTPYSSLCENHTWTHTNVVITSGSLLNLEAYNNIGPFNEDFFIDRIDQEYCLRLRKNGYKIILACKAILFHSLGTPQKRNFIFWTFYPTNHSKQRRYYSARNIVYLTKKYFWSDSKWISYQLLTVIKAIFLILLFEDEKIPKILSIMKGLWHGVSSTK